ncbi:MAG TPA: reverse transcriptase family protein [Bryobacteraceae bacterium]
MARAISRHGQRLTVEQWVVPPPEMRPVDAAVEWSLPVLESPLQLAEWLNLPLNQLEWFADLKHYLRRPRVAQQLRHYNYRILDKGWGSIRLIEAPKDRLKEIQRKILAGILDLIPTHDAVHGFRKGRSIRSFVSPHTAQRVVLKMDLSDFFPSIRRARVQALFRTAGYPEAVADLLGGLCTTTTPREIWKSSGVRDPNRLSDARMIYGTPHLPQGAPTSPAIANLCAYRLDCRLAGLARSAAALYTRYADDLAFSGGDDFERRVERFSLHAAAIVQESGFEVHHRKTRIMRQGVRQQVAGLVTNTHPNIRRSDFDELKAILTNCVRLGPSTQNRDLHANFRAHLEGRVSFIESITPPRGSKLRSIFDRIDWTA